MAIVDKSMDREELDRGDAETPQMIDNCGCCERAEASAQCSGHVLACLREAFYVSLVDDGVFPRDVRPTVDTLVKAWSMTTALGMPRALSRRANKRSARGPPRPE